MAAPRFPKAIVVTQKPVDDCVLVHDAVNDKVHVLNPSAAMILTWCDGTHTIEEMVDAFGPDPGVPKETIYKDIAAILEQFAASGLLEPNAVGS